MALNFNMSKKPTGSIQSLQISTFSDDSTNLQIKIIKFSSDKEEIEKQIVDLFVKTTIKSGFSFLETPKQNKQDDFDFSLTLPGGKVYLELTEFIVKDQEIPYLTSSTPRTCGEFHDMFLKTIDNKIKKASKRLEKMTLLKKELLPVDLLCYTTHADYNIDDVVVVLLQHTLLNYKNPFENIFLLQPIAFNHAHIRVLQPYSDKTIDNNTLVKLRDNQLINLL